MPRGNAALVPDGAPAKRYKLNPDAKVSRSEGGKGTHGFYKDAKSGRLFRLGTEEFFLLSQLGRGRSFEQAGAAFKTSFGQAVRKSTVAGFAAQMVAAGVLLEDNGAAPQPPSAEPPARDGASPVEKAEAAEMDADLLASEPETLPNPDEDIDGLEDLIFSETAPVAPEPTPTDASETDQTKEPAESGAPPSFRAAAMAAREALQAKAREIKEAAEAAEIAQQPASTAAESAQTESARIENTQAGSARTESAAPSDDTVPKPSEPAAEAEEALAAETPNEDPAPAEPTPEDPPAEAARVSPSFDPKTSRFSAGRRGPETPAGADTSAAAPKPANEPNGETATSGADAETPKPSPKKPVFRKTGLSDGVPHKPATPKPGNPGAASGSDAHARAGAEDPADPGTPHEEDAPQIANAAIAGRKVKFERHADLKSDPAIKSIRSLFNPTGLFAAVNAVFGWLGWFKWLLWPLTIFAFMAVFTRLSEYGTSISSARGAIDLFWRIVASTLTVNFFTAFLTGLAIHRQGGETPGFGFRMLFFVIPRFAVDEAGVRKLSREGKLAVYATTMRTRLAIFALGTVFWAFARSSQTVLPDVALLVSQIALITLVLTAFPLSSGDGYKYLTTYFRQEMLKQRAYAWMFKGNQSKLGMTLPEPTPGEKKIFVSYIIGSTLFTGLILSFLLVFVSTALVGRFGGSGVAIFFALLVAFGIWILSMKAKKEEMAKATMKTVIAEKMAEKAAQGGRGGQAGAGMAGGFGGGAGFGGAGGAGAYAAGGGAAAQSRALVPVPQGSRALALGQSRDLTKAGPRPLPGLYAENTAKSRRSKWIFRLSALVLLGALAYAAFQPYEFEVGGEFVILPDTRSEVGARVAGELIEIFVAEGDVVAEGDLLARMSDWEPRMEVEVRRAKLAQAEARLEDLLDGATPEEIAIVEESVAHAQAELPFLLSQAERAQELLDRNAISQVEYERIRMQYETGQIELRTAEARHAEITAPPTTTDVAVAEAEIERLKAELVYHQDQLDKVELRAIAPGRIVSENVHLLRGKYLNVGELFVEIEDHEVARAEVSVSETDIGLVQLGDVVRLKAWAIPDEERLGTVVSIAPSAEVEDFGRVVRVKTQFPNEEGFFRPEMTGFAKIDGAEMKTWEAFTRLFVRFFLIEVWGWIP
ncbi:efflux RND transporter periplasmic adaptor subunit [Dinoroseobacter sp. S76]|uniref:HlyD family secretion protein n=1 Tax=Dinoroseobacter sp. S76 TaxID=3415124 RepID=UPI003C7C5630